MSSTSAKITVALTLSALLGASARAQYTPPAGSSVTGSSFNAGANVITPQQLLLSAASGGYGAKFDVTQGSTGTTNGTAIFTDANAHFLNGNATLNQYPAKANQIFFATFSCLDSTLSEQFGGLEQTTIVSVQSDTQITLAGAASSTTTGTLCYAYGTQNDATAIQAAWAAGGCSVKMFLPGGKAFVDPGAGIVMFPDIAGCPSSANAGSGYIGPGLWGSNVTSTYLIPLPSFQPVNCVTTCFFGNNITDIENLNIWGLGQRCRSNAALPLARAGQATRLINVGLEGWCARGGGAGSIGVQIQGSQDEMTESGSNYFGSEGLSVSAQAPTLIALNSVTCNPVATNGTACIDVPAGALVKSYSNSVAGVINVEGVLSESNDIVSSNGGDPCIQIDGATAVVNLDTNDKICSNVAGAKPIVFFGTAGAILNIGTNHTFTNGSGVPIFTTIAGDTINFVGLNNVFVNNGTGVFSGAGRYVLEANMAQGTAATASNTVLSGGWGTTAAVTALTGGDFPLQFTVTNSGTGQGASPTITYTFPTALPVAPFACSATQTGGNNAVGTLAASALSATGVTFTYSLTPTASDTEIIYINCVTP